MPCTSFDVSGSDAWIDAKASQLLARGWQGDATDGVERLYSPACN